MKVKEYLEAVGVRDTQMITFVISKYAKLEEGYPAREIFLTTPQRCVNEWIEGNSNIKDYIVLNPNQPPIESITTLYNHRNYYDGHLMCMLITPEEEIKKYYSEKQAPEIIEMYDKAIKESLNEL